MCPRVIIKRVDELAKAAADNGSEIDFGYNPGKFTSSRTKNGKAATLFKANGQEVVIRIFQKKIYGKRNIKYKITFDLYDEVSKTYVAKHTAYKIDSSFDLWHDYMSSIYTC